MATSNVKGEKTPASTKILMRHEESEDFNNSFNYRSVIGKIGYLEKATNPALAYINHQCARFVIGTKTEHAAAVRRIGRYIKNTLGKGIVFRPDKKRVSSSTWILTSQGIGTPRTHRIRTPPDPDMDISYHTQGAN